MYPVLFHFLVMRHFVLVRHIKIPTEYCNVYLFKVRNSLKKGMEHFKGTVHSCPVSRRAGGEKSPITIEALSALTLCHHIPAILL